MADLNCRQLRILALMRDQPRRDLFETCGASPAIGSGMFALTYSGDVHYDYLSRAEVLDLKQRGFIEERYADCFKLVGAERRDRKGNLIP